MRFFWILISKFLILVPSKSVPKTPYELWSQKKPSLCHFQKPSVGTLLVIMWDQEVSGFIVRRTPIE